MTKNLLIWTVAIALCVTAGTSALGAIVKNKLPNLSLSLVPTNGFAAENLATRQVTSVIIGNNGQFPNNVNDDTRNIALRAFEAEPIVPDAVAVLALTEKAQLERNLMKMANFLSRRQVLSTSWLIADSSNRDDIPELLRHYDNLLRTNETAGTVVIPIMANALVDNNSIEPYTELLSNSPPWEKQFWDRVVSQPDVLSNAAILRQRLYKSDDPKNSYSDSSLIKMLIKQEKFKEAEKLYMLLSNRSVASPSLGSGGFRSRNIYPPLDWQRFSTGEYGASIEGGTLLLSAVRNSGGRFAQKLVKLPKSDSKLIIALSDSLPTGVDLWLTLSCAEKSVQRTRLIKIPLTGKMTTRQISNQQTQCEFYWLNIYGRSVDDQEGFDVAINAITLNPI